MGYQLPKRESFVMENTCFFPFKGERCNGSQVVPPEWTWAAVEEGAWAAGVVHIEVSILRTKLVIVVVLFCLVICFCVVVFFFFFFFFFGGGVVIMLYSSTGVMVLNIVICTWLSIHFTEIDSPTSEIDNYLSRICEMKKSSITSILVNEHFKTMCFLKCILISYVHCKVISSNNLHVICHSE